MCIFVILILGLDGLSPVIFFPAPEDMQPRVIAKILRCEYEHAFQKLRRMTVSCSTSTDVGVEGVPDEITNCLICNARRHQCSWLYRENMAVKRRCNGGTCNACHKACGWLGCSRSPPLLRESGALEPVLKASALKRQKLGDKDVCTCADCSTD